MTGCLRGRGSLNIFSGGWVAFACEVITSSFAADLRGKLLVFPLQHPWIVMGFLEGFELLLEGFQRLLMIRIFGEVFAFIGIVFEVVELKLGTLEVFVDGLQTEGGVRTFFELGLPGGGAPQIGGKGKGQLPGDVPDEFVFLIADDPHGIIHLHFVECV